MHCTVHGCLYCTALGCVYCSVGCLHYTLLLGAHPHTDTKQANVRVTRGLITQNTNTRIRFTHM